MELKALMTPTGSIFNNSANYTDGGSLSVETGSGSLSAGGGGSNGSSEKNQNSDNKKDLSGPGPKQPKSSKHPVLDFMIKGILTMKQPTPWHGDLIGLAVGPSFHKGPVNGEVSTGLVLTGDGNYSRTSASANILGYGADFSENINLDNGNTSLDGSLVQPGTDNWSIDVIGVKIYGSISADVGYLVNLKESYFNFLSQSWYNWTHPYEK